MFARYLSAKDGSPLSGVKAVDFTRKLTGIYCGSYGTDGLTMVLTHDDVGRLVVRSIPQEGIITANARTVHKAVPDRLKSGEIVLVLVGVVYLVSEVLSAEGVDEGKSFPVVDVVSREVRMTTPDKVFFTLDTTRFNNCRKEITFKRRELGKYLEDQYIRLDNLSDTEVGLFIGSFVFNKNEEILGVLVNVLNDYETKTCLGSVAYFDGTLCMKNLPRKDLYIRPIPSPLIPAYRAIDDLCVGNLVLGKLENNDLVVGGLSEIVAEGSEIEFNGNKVMVEDGTLGVTSDMHNLNLGYIRTAKEE